MTRSEAGRTVLALFFVAAGTLHFVVPAYYRAIVPSYLPAPATLVAVTGAAEIAGGAGLLVPRLRQAAGVGLIVLLPAPVAILQLYRASGGSGGRSCCSGCGFPSRASLRGGPGD